MNRKSFLSSMVVLPAAIPLSAKVPSNSKMPAVIPPYLQQGSLIGITSPAGYITETDIQPAIQQIEGWGFKPVIGDTIGKRFFGFGGTDEERTGDLQRMLDDPSLRAIMCARGGYGSIRLIDKLNFTEFLKKPKWILGFSDITVIHNHLNFNYGIASIHSKMCNSFPYDWSKAEPLQADSILSIRRALSGEKMTYNVLPGSMNKAGIAEGVLVGGNLKTIETLTGSRSDLDTAGKILFVEDTGEYLYSVDRMFWNLKRSGKLSRLKALVIGGFKLKPDNPGEEFGGTLYDLVLDKVSEYDYPVCFDFPVGHQKENYALKCGVKHSLDVNSSGVTLREV
ncbi:MAG TPA: LD-carboxypeptidase [Chitinophagaceae bacterium]|jgi:muramoyltetrapeptide carboxypeptidase|nr:LD-carboxypeptidase [Chitinophagaceae bacterium]